MKTRRPIVLFALVGVVLVFAAGINPAAPQAEPKQLDSALKNLASFQAGIDSVAYWKFREVVSALRNDPAARPAAETQLLAFLQTNAPLPAKMAVCRELRLVGSAASVPILEKFLRDKNMSDPARYALEKISGPAADRALLRALDKTSGALRVGIISSLGFRKTPDAAAPLAKLLAGKDLEAAVAAAYSLGRIGTDSAATALAGALKSPSPPIRDAAASAALECADAFLKLSRVPAAAALIESVLSAKPAASARRAATILKISAAGEGASKILFDSLRSNDAVIQEAAVWKMKDVIPADNLGEVTGLLPVLPEGSRVKILAVLAEYPRERVLPTFLACLKSPAAFERIAALTALGTAGDSSVIPALAEAAANSTGNEQAAARESLGLVKGRDADEAILSLLDSDASEAVKTELIRAVGERRIFSGKSALIARLADPSPSLRIQALKVLRVIGTPSDVPAALNHLAEAADDAEREETENTAAALAVKIARPIGRSDTIKERLTAEMDPERKAGLIRILGKVGDDSSLPDLREALRFPDPVVKDAAVRVLTDWPTATPVEDVYEVAKTAESETHRLLALRGFIRMIALGKFRNPENAVSDLRLALEMSRRPEEKRLVLAALPDFACPEALKLARSFLNDADVKAEAKAAAEAIEEKLK